MREHPEDRPRRGEREPAARPIAPIGDQRTRPSLLIASRFIDRFAELSAQETGQTIAAWRRAVSTDAEEWFAAEAALGQTVRQAGRQYEQEVLLERLVDALRRNGWLRQPQPGTQGRASEASLQYVATIGLLAILVRDRLTPPLFQTLYRPFAELIPPEQLDGR